MNVTGEASRLRQAAMVRGFCRITAAAALLGLSISPTIAAPSVLAGAVAEVHAAEAAVAADTKASDGFALDDRPGAAARLEEQWRTIRRWTALWLATHPGARPGAAAAAARRDINAEMTVRSLGGGAEMVGVAVDALGTAFVLRPVAGGGLVTAMAADEPGTWGGGGPAELAAWRSDRAGFGCRDKHRQVEWAACGPLAPETRVLPAEAGGAGRFALLGRYVKQMGATDGYQLTIWRWTGTRAEPLLVRTFAQMAEEPVFAGIGRDTLRVRTKGEWKQLFACGSCSGRQLELTIALSASGARLAGSRSLVPDLDLIDTLLDRLFRSQPADDLATPAALAWLTPRVLAVIAKDRALKIEPAAGMLIGWKPAAWRVGVGVVCLEVDALEGAGLFTIDRRSVQPRVTAIGAAPGGACKGAGSRF